MYWNFSVRVAGAEVEANLNAYFDQLVGNIRTWAKTSGLDPLPLPDQIKSFSKVRITDININFFLLFKLLLFLK